MKIKACVMESLVILVAHIKVKVICLSPIPLDVDIWLRQMKIIIYHHSLVSLYSVTVFSANGSSQVEIEKSLNSVVRYGW